MRFSSAKNLTSTPIAIVIMLIGFACNYLLGIFLAQTLGARHYGEYSLAAQILKLVAFIALLGTAMSDKQYLANFLRQKNEADVLIYIRWNLKLIRVTYTICWLVALASFLTMIILHYYGVHDIRKYNLAVYMLWISPLAASIFLLCSYLLANNNFLWSSFLQNILINASYLIYFYIAFKLWPNNIDNIKIILVFFVSSCSVLIICWYLTYKKISLLKEISLRDVFYNKMERHADWLKTSIRLAISNITYYLTTTLIFFLLQIILHHQESIAYYSACLTICAVIWILGTAIALPFQPIISTLMQTADGKNTLQRKINRANLLALILFSLISLLIISYSGKILLLFGPDFIAATTTLNILLAATLFNTMFIIGQLILSYSGYSKEVMVYRLITFFVTIILGVLLTFYYGINGMAAAFLIAMLLGLVLITVTVRVKTAIRVLTVI